MNQPRAEHGRFGKKTVVSYGGIKEVSQAFSDCFTENDVVVLHGRLMEIANDPAHPKQVQVLKILTDYMGEHRPDVDTAPRPMFRRLEDYSEAELKTLGSQP
jgi:hypothetical protein